MESGRRLDQTPVVRFAGSGGRQCDQKLFLQRTRKTGSAWVGLGLQQDRRPVIFKATAGHHLPQSRLSRQLEVLGCATRGSRQQTGRPCELTAPKNRTWTKNCSSPQRPTLILYSSTLPIYTFPIILPPNTPTSHPLPSFHNFYVYKIFPHPCLFLPYPTCTPISPFFIPLSCYHSSLSPFPPFLLSLSVTYNPARKLGLGATAEEIKRPGASRAQRAPLVRARCLPGPGTSIRMTCIRACLAVRRVRDGGNAFAVARARTPQLDASRLIRKAIRVWAAWAPSGGREGRSRCHRRRGWISTGKSRSTSTILGHPSLGRGGARGAADRPPATGCTCVAWAGPRFAGRSLRNVGVRAFGGGAAGLAYVAEELVRSRDHPAHSGRAKPDTLTFARGRKRHAKTDKGPDARHLRIAGLARGRLPEFAGSRRGHIVGVPGGCWSCTTTCAGARGAPPGRQRIHAVLFIFSTGAPGAGRGRAADRKGSGRGLAGRKGKGSTCPQPGGNGQGRHPRGGDRCAGGPGLHVVRHKLLERRGRAPGQGAKGRMGRPA